jgi:uncharacterized radical SAM superfamily Fe-S cluster-containing enzyme
LTLAAPLTAAERSSRLSSELAALDEAAARTWFELAPTARLLKTTLSLCPECLEPVACAVYAEGGRVLGRKSCPRHGRSEAVFENDERYYFLSNKDTSGRSYAHDRVFDIPPYEMPGGGACCEGGACGTGTDQSANKTCTILVEITNACNLACPVCYSDAKGDRMLPAATFERYIERLVEQKGGLDSVQLTGGEALLHPEFWRMVAFLHAHPRVNKIYLPTNGILVSRPEVLERLAGVRDKLMVLLQFDGLSTETDRTLRAASPGQLRARAVRELHRLGIAMQLTMTIAEGVNEGEIGAVVRYGLGYDSVKVIALQPVTTSGRYTVPLDPMRRSTLSDIAKSVARASGLSLREADFVPIPCSHPNCGWITLFVRRFGLTTNILKFVDLGRVKEQVAYRTLLSSSELRRAVGSGGGPLQRLLAWLGKRLVRSTDVFTVAIKPFMDRHTYDQDRVKNCCHHLLDTQGNALSFCEYNALLRAQDSWASFPELPTRARA